MKQKRLLFYLPWLLVAALCMPLVGCSSDDDDDDDEPETKTFTFNHFKQEGRYLVGYPDLSMFCWTVWNQKGASFDVYIIQKGKIYDAGLIHSNDTLLTEEEKTSKSLTFDVEIPATIKKEGAYKVFALSNVDASLSGENIECKADLRRSGTIPTWDNSLETNGKSYALSTIETLSVRNSTSETITVKHKGFEVKDKWYCSKAKVVLDADMKVAANGSVGEDVVSGAYKATPGNYATIWSYYVPTGKKMKDARLVLEINGKEYKTQPISSDVNIEFSHYYRMTVQWDGKSLKWVLGDGETRGMKGKDMFSNADIISCGDPSTNF